LDVPLAKTFRGPAYLDLTRQQKLARLRVGIQACAGVSGNFSENPIQDVVTQNLGPTIEYEGDAMGDFSNVLRKKIVHSVGVVGEVKFVSNGKHPFTGLYKGCDSAIIRFSSGLPF